MTKKQQIKLIKEYLIKEYGEAYFTKSDIKRMEFDDDGTVYIGWAQIKTDIRYNN